MMPDIGSRRLGARGSPYGSPFSSPFISRRVVSDSATEGGDASAGDQQQELQTSLLLARVRSIEVYCNRVNLL